MARAHTQLMARAHSEASPLVGRPIGDGGQPRALISEVFVEVREKDCGDWLAELQEAQGQSESKPSRDEQACSSIRSTSRRR